MVTPLLTTKLYIPPIRPELVSRPRLVERLNAGLHRKLTLISAPAGFGKTTLLSEWAAGCGRPVAWVSLDEGDNDPARFLAYFVAALQTVEANAGESVLNAFHASQPPPMESVLTSLINEIVTFQQEQFALVLDDYHAINTEAVHNALTFLLDHLPDNMHLVIATRADPPLPIARLRGRGQVTELRADDLRFTADEAAEFLSRVMGLSLSADDVATLASRTEGWIAGLQMAAVSMQGREDIAGFIQAFTGSDRYILDYLVEEVLQHQPDSIQTFLLQTSILDRLTGPLCDAITGQDDGQATLERLERANLFIVPLDNERRWYRYHHLFADLLRQRLQQAPSSVPPACEGDERGGVLELHRRASAWYEQNGLTAEAIDHALSAKDFERGANLIERAADATMMRSQIATLQSWVEALPDDLARARPLLYVYQSWVRLLSGHPVEETQARLQMVEKADTSGSVSGALAAFRALLAIYQGDWHTAVELGRRAMELLPEDSLFLRSLIAGFLSLNHLWKGEIMAARQAFEEAVRISQKAGNLMNAVLALNHLGEVSVIQGQLREAKAYYEQMLGLAVEQGRQQPIAGLALIGLGHLSHEWNELEAALRHCVEGTELVKKWGELGALNGYIGLALTKQALGDVEGAQAAIKEAQQIAARFDAMILDDLSVAMQQAHLWVLQGNLEAASRWARERGLDDDASVHELEHQVNSDVSPLLRALEFMVLAEVRIAQGQPDRALKLLRLLIEMAEKAEWTGYVISMLLLEALALQAQGNISQAMIPLQRALSLAEPEGYVRTFIDGGEPMAALLRQAAARGIAVDYVSKLLAAFGGETKGEMRRTEPSSSSLVEPLSERELEVLRFLTTDLSSTEIAQELVVSVNTVRSHIKSIYSKLNVHSRYEAVARAKELNLL